MIGAPDSKPELVTPRRLQLLAGLLLLLVVAAVVSIVRTERALDAARAAEFRAAQAESRAMNLESKVNALERRVSLLNLQVNATPHH